MNVEIREYTNQDTEQIIAGMDKFQEYLVAIDPLKRLRKVSSYAEKYTADFLEKIKTGNGKIYVAIDDSKVIGFIGGFVVDQTELDLIGHLPAQYGRINDLYVEEAYRGSGVGKQLMKRMEAYLKDQKCDFILIEVFGPNHSAHEFYKGLGYADRDYEMQKGV